MDGSGDQIVRVLQMFPIEFNKDINVFLVYFVYDIGFRLYNIVFLKSIKIMSLITLRIGDRQDRSPPVVARIADCSSTDRSRTKAP